MLHVNRMVFGAPNGVGQASGSPEPENAHRLASRPETSFRLPFSSRLALILADTPVLLFGIYIPKPLDQLLTAAGAVTALAHGLAFCQAVEAVGRVEVPARAKALRVFLAELERLRQHVGAIQEIRESPALVVANSQAEILEEGLLWICCELTGHRYLLGLLALGGLLCDLPDPACRRALTQAHELLKGLDGLDADLRLSGSFLDRLEEVGFVPTKNALAYDLLGPVARASGVSRASRRAQPYSDYEHCQSEVPVEPVFHRVCLPRTTTPPQAKSAPSSIAAPPECSARGTAKLSRTSAGVFITFVACAP